MEYSNQAILLVVFAVVVIVFIGYSLIDINGPNDALLPLIILCGLGIAGGLYYSWNITSGRSERFIDEDDLEFSKYGNISLRNDIDTMKQQKLDMNITPSNDIDNSDVVASVVGRGNTVFQPAGTGSTTSNAGQMSKFSLAGPSGLPYLDESPAYDIAQVDKNSLDELLTRAAVHRGSLAKRSLDGYVRSTRNIYQKYFADELNENSNREWWGNTGDKLETDFTAYDINV
jgi:hypothetical protein